MKNRLIHILLNRACQLFLLLAGSFVTPFLLAMPDELYQGMVRYELESGNYFNALTLMDEDYKERNKVDHASALLGFNITSDVDALLQKAYGQSKALNKAKQVDKTDYFNIGRIEYQLGRCKPALRAFKRLKNKLTFEQKQEWAFYRANCFIRLGSNTRAAQVLNDNLDGIWTSYAYYNLAISYDKVSRNKTEALVALRIAASMNKGKTNEEIEVNNRINFSAGAIYLGGGKPDLASDFFKKVYLDSEVAPEALYLNGVAKLELNDFRSATQSWFSVKKYPLVNQSVAESLLAIPYAYERSGYTSQALEAYLEASSTFETELEVIAKVDRLLEQHGVQKILIEDNDIEGLEWFLAKDVVTNTTRATYYTYFMKNPDIYDGVELFSELKMLGNSMEFWSSQLAVFNKLLKTKNNNFARKSRSFNANKTQKEIERISKTLNAVQSNEAVSPKIVSRLQLDALLSNTDILLKRLSDLKQKVAKGRGRLTSQLAASAELNERIEAAQKQVKALLNVLDKQLTIMVRAQLSVLNTHMQSNFERAEQGLVHIFESIAESNQLKRNLLDGRYK